MRQQTRYEIKQSAKEEITVSRSSSHEDLELFQSIQADTAKRQGFVPPSAEFLRIQLEVFKDKFKIYKAEKNGELLSMAIIIYFGNEADYYEGASTRAGRKLPGAYAIQWQAIKDAKSVGLKRYNFWGIAPTGSPKHRYAGVTIFKCGFGGDDVDFVPAHDLVIKRFSYLKTWLVEFVRKKVRKL
jgi:lipid II:glycine glycyltransferase (peptidoglycan interpeptide bridge formation enzyme)